MTITVQDHLQSFLTQHGEESWKAEIQRLALAALRSGSEKAAAFWKALTKDYEWLDWAHLEAQAQATSLPPSTERLIAETLKSQMPGIRSQAQYDAIVSAMEALQVAINGILEGNEGKELDGKKALDLAFDTIVKATELTLKLEDVPEAASSAASQSFKETPAQFQEVDLEAALLQELKLIRSVEELRSWYESKTTKERRDKIVTQTLRNELLDAVRAKRKALT